MSTGNPGSQSDDVRDLQVVLTAGLLVPVLMGGLIFLTWGPNRVITIPTAEVAIAAALALLISLGGWLALRAKVRLRSISWAVLIAYTLAVTGTVHYTGGPSTPMPGLYVLVVSAASFLLGQRATSYIAMLSVVLYAALLTLEYTHVLITPDIWRVGFDPQKEGFLLIVNWMAMATPTALTAFLGGSLASRLKTRNQQLKESEELRTRLTEMLVHDLRNPLTALLGGLDIINLVLGKQMNADQRHLLDNARHSGHTLLAMIGDMLDVTKMEAGQLQLKPQPLNIEIMLAEIIEQVYALAEMESLQIDLEPVEIMPEVPGDRQLIQRVLANLTSNAIKHTPPGGTITLTARRYQEKFVAVSVRDTGEGIPPEQQARLFEKFGQLEQGGLVRRGTGLGLWFCKMAVEAHGGRIWVESNPGAGSNFVFTLPLPNEKSPSILPQQTQPSASPAGASR